MIMRPRCAGAGLKRALPTTPSDHGSASLVDGRAGQARVEEGLEGGKGVGVEGSRSVLEHEARETEAAKGHLQRHRLSIRDKKKAKAEKQNRLGKGWALDSDSDE